MTRRRPVAYKNSVKAAITAAVATGPKTSREIAAAIGSPGSGLGVYFAELVREGVISRYEYSRAAFRYYPGNSAPAGSFRDGRPAVAKPAPKPAPRQHKMPVKVVTVRPFSLAGEAGISAQITLPAAPWECVA